MALATTAALTVGVTAPSLQNQAAPQVVDIDEHRIVDDAEVALSAIAGLYGVGPIFWAAEALGITPENVVRSAVGTLGSPLLDDTVELLFDALGLVFDTGAPGPLPGDVYGRVNGLNYTTDLILDTLLAGVKDREVWSAFLRIFGVDVGGARTVGDAVRAVADQFPILKQRRAVILSEGLGGLTTSLAYRDMIKAVTSDDPDWEPGVTGQWLIFVNNPGRPGGGLFALATPLTSLVGLNLTTPAGGSYVNDPDDPTKVLNTSVLDIGWAYNVMSDAPTTLSLLAWANALAGAIFLSHLIPDDLNIADTNLLEQALAVGLANGVAVLLDPTGGQGSKVVPILGDLIDALNTIPLVDLPHVPGLNGTSTYITYDSGNLPLLEPFDVLPRMLGMVGLNVPQPVLNSVENALRLAINTSYQDVDPVTLERRFDMAGRQAVFGQSPLTPSQQFDAGWLIANTLINDIQDNLLNPVAWTPSVAGQPVLNEALRALIQNAAAIAVSQLINAGIDVVQDIGEAGFGQVRTALTPVLDVADELNRQTRATTTVTLQVDQPATAAKTSEKPAAAATSALQTSAADTARTAPAIDTDGDDEPTAEAGKPVEKTSTQRRTRTQPGGQPDKAGHSGTSAVDRPASKPKPPSIGKSPAEKAGKSGQRDGRDKRDRNAA
jgi:hypothetical protein